MTGELAAPGPAWARVSHAARHAIRTTPGARGRVRRRPWARNATGHGISTTPLRMGAPWRVGGGERFEGHDGGLGDDLTNDGRMRPPEGGEPVDQRRVREDG